MQELLRPWKLVTLAIGLGLLIAGSFVYEAPDWDIPVSVLMALVAYVTAPWCMRVMVERRLRHWPAMLFLTWFGVDGCYAAEPPAVPYFKAICIEEKATGFNWDTGAWKQANFRPAHRLLVEKVNFEANQSKPYIERFLKCQRQTSSTLAGFTNAQACYVIKTFGEKTIPLADGEMCRESFDGEKLFEISCPKLTFLPDGPFIRVPSLLDLDTQTKNKDSLVLSVGTCTSFSD